MMMPECNSFFGGIPRNGVQREMKSVLLPAFVIFVFVMFKLISFNREVAASEGQPVEG